MHPSVLPAPLTTPDIPQSRVWYHGTQYRLHGRDLAGVLFAVHTFERVLGSDRQGEVLAAIVLELFSGVAGRNPSSFSRLRTEGADRMVQNIATDVVIFILPLPTLFKLQTSLRRRVAVMSIMSVGGISLIVSCLRLIVYAPPRPLSLFLPIVPPFRSASILTPGPSLHQFAADLDFAYLLGKMVIMSAAELETMIVAANIPSYKALWVHGLGWKVFWGSTRNESTGGAQKLSGYELTHHSRLRAPTKEIGIDTEIGLHDSQEELCKNEAAAARAGGIQVSRDFTVTSDRCGERDAAKLDKERNRAYYDVGNS